MRPVLEDDDDDAEEDVGGHRTDAFERRYLDERSWEALAEDEHGRLVASTTAAVQRKRVRAADTGERVRRGLIRYLILVLDMSETCATSYDMPPNRAVAITALARKFIAEFFDQNPLSQMSVLAMRHGRAYTLSEFSASLPVHLRCLEGSIDTGGAVSLQNMLDQACQAGQTIPPFGTREVLVLLSSLTTCDPGNIADSIKATKAAALRVTVVGLSAEMYISSKIAADTGGTYRVAVSQAHLAELVMDTCAPPAIEAARTQPNLVRMAFPSKDADGARHAAFVGDACAVATGAYVCPVCAAKNAGIPCDCHVCGITLISSPHLARSYHHLFPIAAFAERDAAAVAEGQACAFCCVALRPRGAARMAQAGVQAYECPKCTSVCCADCDDFVHEHLHNCPGCEASAQ